MLLAFLLLTVYHLFIRQYFLKDHVVRNVLNLGYVGNLDIFWLEGEPYSWGRGLLGGTEYVGGTMMTSLLIILSAHSQEIWIWEVVVSKFSHLKQIFSPYASWKCQKTRYSLFLGVCRKGTFFVSILVLLHEPWRLDSRVRDGTILSSLPLLPICEHWNIFLQSCI